MLNSWSLCFVHFFDLKYKLPSIKQGPKYTKNYNIFLIFEGLKSTNNLFPFYGLKKGCLKAVGKEKGELK